MTVLICPGIHPPTLTQDFLAALGRQPDQDLVFPADRYPAYSACHIWQFLQCQLQGQIPEGVLFIGFSAGVVGAIGAATLWQELRGTVKTLIAIDGWGVPLVGNFPIHRISHDFFTHWSSNCLGGGGEGFYADPPMTHLQLWQSPHHAAGWWLNSDGKANGAGEVLSSETALVREGAIYTTLPYLLCHLLQRYGEA